MFNGSQTISSISIFFKITVQVLLLASDSNSLVSKMQSLTCQRYMDELGI